VKKFTRFPNESARYIDGPCIFSQLLSDYGATIFRWRIFHSGLRMCLFTNREVTMGAPHAQEVKNQNMKKLPAAFNLLLTAASRSF